MSFVIRREPRFCEVYEVSAFKLAESPPEKCILAKILI